MNNFFFGILFILVYNSHCYSNTHRFTYLRTYQNPKLGCGTHFTPNSSSNEPKNSLIRNFCIIAHVDHGKSTLADRILEYTKSVNHVNSQHLDNMELERERGITIKLQSARIKYTANDGNEYTLNLIDTPGHIDFNHEATRSISACEGAILVVDGTKGIQAQTITTAQIAITRGVVIIPVVNKIDMEACDFEGTSKQIQQIFKIPPDDILKISAKTGVGVGDVLERIISKIPPPVVYCDKPTRALIFDSLYDPHKGAIGFIRMIDGRLTHMDEIYLCNTKLESKIKNIGLMLPELQTTDVLESGQVGWFSANIKDPTKLKVGDTLVIKKDFRRGLVSPVYTFEDAKPTVYCGMYPTDGTDFQQLKIAMEKLKLNDHSFTFEPDDSGLAGHGFHCGFNGILHMDIIRQRLNREFNVSVIITCPSVPYKCELRNGNTVCIRDASHWPKDGTICKCYEPWTELTLHVPKESIGKTMKLLERMRGVFVSKDETSSVVLKYQAPLIEVISDFFDNLKSITNGYGSFDYQDLFYKESELVKIRIIVNGEEAHGLSTICIKSKAHETGKKIVEALKATIPSQQFKVPLQAAIGNRVVASVSIPALRKNVTQGCYGGDQSRKNKLLDRQAKGKQMMAQYGKVRIPADSYKAVIKAMRSQL
ncbi:GTP-binding protein LepA [Babesia microti strain RI]|uniref:Translation factor GUF1 homolog, mitochondrial n=1 Tax=Babesia microti (strain RI) TaxID=1133968 RepID=A0A1N6LW91_BABMR|nr:GTP-binding protein LepA [Babesia microti strain RI]SIO73145.1 GTP-binding protein LepA [Babesia microti strain RI]|eukprot:XP_021337257.1 GTP-binding protein LepA [Babesia microti strain RI]